MATKEKEKKPAVKDGGGAKAPGAKSAQKAASKGKKGDAKAHGPHAGAGLPVPPPRLKGFYNETVRPKLTQRRSDQAAEGARFGR